MRKFTYFILSLLLFVSCNIKRNANDYLSWMYKYMPLQDSLGFNRDWWLSNINKTLEARDKMGWNIPEREFKHFVLPLRVNNEYLDDFRLVYADTLCNRVKGMSMQEAALEINHWCFEQATYRGSDARTMSPVSVVNCGFGRCGEESVLAVAALRAAGLPARQVYTPRWAHTDDNHAWVEVWIDGKWHFMGACEPEPVLDLGWFNAPLSRALVLTTNVFGDYKGKESVIEKNDCFTKINVINSYVPSRRAVVKVVDTLGNIVPDAIVEFTIYNYAEFCPVIKTVSNENGTVSVDMGLGAMLVRASKDNHFGLAALDSKSATVVLNKKTGDVFSVDFNIVPPVENPLPSKATEAQIEENKLRLSRETEIRNSHDHTNPAIGLFKEKYGKKAEILLSYLSKKDFDDITYDVLEDAMLALPDIRQDVLCPRVELEQLLPFRKSVLELGLNKVLKSYSDVDKWIDENIKIIVSKQSLNLIIPPAVILNSRCANMRSLRVFKVALCRAVGLPASIDSITGNTSMELASMAKGKLILRFNRAEELPEYYRNFTISRYEGGKSRLLNFENDIEKKYSNTIEIQDLESGYYCITTGKRLSDGSVLSRLDFFNIRPSGVTNKELVTRNSAEDVRILGEFAPEGLEITDIDGSKRKFSDFPDSGYYLFAFLGQRDEPSMHALRNLKTIVSDLEKLSTTILVFGNNSLKGVSDRIVVCNEDRNVSEYLSGSVPGLTGAKPLIVLCDATGKVYYVSQGYNPILSAILQDKIKELVK